MPSTVLINNSEKYGGKYVATKSFKSKQVISSGKTPASVFNAAQKKGIKNPVIFYVPEKGSVHIY